MFPDLKESMFPNGSLQLATAVDGHSILHYLRWIYREMIARWDCHELMLYAGVGPLKPQNWTMEPENDDEILPHNFRLGLFSCSMRIFRDVQSWVCLWFAQEHVEPSWTSCTKVHIATIFLGRVASLQNMHSAWTVHSKFSKYLDVSFWHMLNKLQPLKKDMNYPVWWYAMLGITATFVVFQHVWCHISWPHNTFAGIREAFKFELKKATAAVLVDFDVHSRKLTWNLKMMVSNRNLLFQVSIFGCHVSFPECS